MVYRISAAPGATPQNISTSLNALSAGGNDGQCVLAVQLIRGGDVDDVDVGVAQQRGVGVVGAFDAVVRGERLCPGEVARCDRDDALIRVLRDRARPQLRDAPRRENAPAKDGPTA